MEYPENLTDRMIRKRHLEIILKNANNVILYGSDEDCLLFVEYTKINKYICMKEDDFENCVISARDVVFLLTMSPEKARMIIASLTSKGCSPIQIIPPGVFWVYILAERRGFIFPAKRENMQLPFLATIDTVNACNLDCVTCWKNSKAENSHIMDFQLFSSILDKLQMINIQQVELYDWTEPFLNPNLYQFAKEVKRRGLCLGISTNLALPNIANLKECVDLLTEHDWFVVTISGTTQEMYEINHRKGKFSNVLKNLEVISQSDKRKFVRLRLLKFDYNISEVIPAINLAKKYGVSFEWHPASGSPFGDVNKNRQIVYDAVEKGFSLNSFNKIFEPDGFYCKYIHSRNIVINSYGNVEVCCNYATRPYDLGSFLDQDISVIQLKRDLHPLCHKCSEKGENRKSLKNLPLDEHKTNYVLNHGIQTMNMCRRVNALNFFDGILRNREFEEKLIEYFLNPLDS